MKILDAPSLFIATGGAGGGVANLVDTTNPISGTIGSNTDGSGNYFDGLIEDFRIYNEALSDRDMRKILFSRGLDNPENDPRLVLRWKLIGNGAVVSEVDTISGSVATPVNGPSYGGLLTRTRRRNRSG